MITVAELIAELGAFPPDMKVLHISTGGTIQDADEIRMEPGKDWYEPDENVVVIL